MLFIGGFETGGGSELWGALEVVVDDMLFVGGFGTGTGIELPSLVYTCWSLEPTGG